MNMDKSVDQTDSIVISHGKESNISSLVDTGPRAVGKIDGFQENYSKYTLRKTEKWLLEHKSTTVVPVYTYTHKHTSTHAPVVN